MNNDALGCLYYELLDQNGRTHNIWADGTFINDGGDLIFYMKIPATKVEGIYIPSISHNVASFATGHWKHYMVKASI